MRKGLLAANIVVALAFAIAPHLAPVESMLGLSEPSAAFAWLVTVGSVLYAFTSTALLWIHEDGRRSLEDTSRKLEQYLEAPDVRALRDDEFYDRFLASIRRSTSDVRICYFSPESPDAQQRVERDRYYQDLHDVVAQKPGVVFRRLVRDTQANRRWVCGQLPEWARHPNISVALLPDFPPGEEMSHALSVQVVDAAEAWLVAVESHERIGRYRDLEIRDRTVAGFLTKYFERLWQQAKVVIENGNLTDRGLELQAECEAVER
jgi:hypothetical protein